MFKFIKGQNRPKLNFLNKRGLKKPKIEGGGFQIFGKTTRKIYRKKTGWGKER